jgi:hypothetical protein
MHGLRFNMSGIIPAVAMFLIISYQQGFKCEQLSIV